MRIFAACLLLFAVQSIHAANFSVSNTADSGTGSLRQAILDANTDGGINTITFSAAFATNGVILLQSALPTISTSELTILGSTKLPRIDGQNLRAILRVSNTLTKLFLRDLILRNGAAANDGACINGNNANSGALLSLNNVEVDNCHINDVSLVYGGAIYWKGNTLFIFDSVIKNNSSTASGSSGQSGGGAIYTTADTAIGGTLFSGNAVFASSAGGGTGGAISLEGTDRISNIRDSTFLHNSASPASTILGYGGGINLRCNTCSLNAYRNYFRGNSANYGGGIYASKSSAGTLDVILYVNNNTFYNNSVVTSGGAIQLTRSILVARNNTFYNNDSSEGSHLGFAALNTVSSFHANLFAPTYSGSACNSMSGVTLSGTSVSGNLFSDTTCTGITNVTPSIPNTPLGLISVDETIGQVGVLKFTGSAVIDSLPIETSCEATDARFQSRPIDGDDNGIALCDVGAFEHPSSMVFSDGFE